MRHAVKIVVILVALVLTACSYQFWQNALVPKEESQFAQTYLQKLQSRDFDYVKKYLDPGLLDQVNDQALQKVVDYLPSGDLISTELIGSQVNVVKSARTGQEIWNGNFSFEYHYTGGWALGNVVMVKQDGTLTVTGFHVYRTTASQKVLNQFTLAGKSVLQYGVLCFAVVAFFVTLLTTIVCFRTPIKRRKWLWVLFVAFGIGQISVDWTSGAFFVRPFAVNLFGAGAFATSPYSAWQIIASLPIGALVFWLKRDQLIRSAQQSADEKKEVPQVDGTSSSTAD